MITQNLLFEMETAMLRSFNRASAKVTPLSKLENNFVGTSKYKEEFIKLFLTEMEERRPQFHQEIVKGGHKNFPLLADKIYRMTENKLRHELTNSLLKRNPLDDAALKKIIRELKVEVRDIFYEPSNPLR